jgi:tellurite resistance protein TehA-like permease
MANMLLDDLVVLFALVFFAFLCLVFLVRAFGKEKLELALAPAFSVQLAPFALLWVANILTGADILRIVTLVPIMIFLAFDLWYRLLTRRKPVHHPKKWPLGLVGCK